MTLKPQFVSSLRKLGTLIPALLVAAFFSDRALRRVPLEWTVERPWEPMLRNDAPSFLPSQSVLSARSVGDLVVIGNLHGVSDRRTERFTTDSLGFRNPPHLAMRPRVDGIVLGDSFVWGVGLDDSESLTVQLYNRHGLTFYNAGSTLNADHSWVMDLIQRRPVQGGTLVYVFAERRPLPEIATGTAKASGLLPALFGPWTLAVERLRSAQDGYSPLQVWSERAMRQLQDDVWLPNSRASYVAVETLSDGRPMAFFKEEIAAVTAKRAVNVEYWQELQRKLGEYDVRLLVMLIPSKYGVYYPMLRAASYPAPFDYLAELQTALEAQSIRTLNLGPVFRKEAAERYAKGEFIFWPYDTHWNPTGVAIAADALAQAMRTK